MNGKRRPVTARVDDVRNIRLATKQSGTRGDESGPPRSNWDYDKVQVQAGMLSSAGDSAGIGLVFAAALMESETTQLAPAKAMQIALPAQLK